MPTIVGSPTISVKQSNGAVDQRRVVVSRATGEAYERDGRPIPKPTAVPESMDREAVATLLYSGTVFPPATVFRDYAAVGMAGELSLNDGRLEYAETPDPFGDTGQPSTAASFDAITELCGALERSGVDFDSAVLLLSEGKDSTALALALAELGKRVDCLHFANADSNVDLVEQVANSCGHRLRVVRYATTTIPLDSLERLRQVFEPTLDQAFLSYLLLPMAGLEGRTLIDGMGNDVYMGHLPSKQQLRATGVCGGVERVIPAALRRRLRDAASSDAPWAGIPFRSFTECQGLYNGLSESLITRSTGGTVRRLEDIDRDWRRLGHERARALSRGRYLDTYSFSGKTIALAEMVSGRVYFPWADESLAGAYLKLRDAERFQWPVINKLPLRRAIAKRMVYEQPKVGFRAPVKEILHTNAALVRRVVGESRILGQPLRDQLATLPIDSPRLVCGFLFALWESASQ